MVCIAVYWMQLQHEDMLKTALDLCDQIQLVIRQQRRAGTLWERLETRAPLPLHKALNFIKYVLVLLFASRLVLFCVIQVPATLFLFDISFAFETDVTTVAVELDWD